ATFTREQLVQDKPLKPEDLLKPAVEAPVEFEEDDEAKKRLKSVPGRDKRQQARNERARQRKGREAEAELKATRTLTLDDDRPQSTRKLIRRMKQQRTITQPRKDKVPLRLPITVRDLSKAVGLNSGELIFKLKDHGAGLLNINSTVEPEMAQIIALETGAE